MTSQDAKLPWRFSAGDIVDVGGVPWVVDTDEDIAALIVRAVNHHEALVEIVRALTFDATGDSAGDMVRFGQAYDRGRVLLRTLDADNA